MPTPSPAGVYRPRQPERTVLYRVLSQHFERYLLLHDEELRRYADPEKYPASETILVELASHLVRSKHEPHVEIMIGRAEVGRVDFEFEMALTLDGAVLEVRDGKIHSVRTGSCQASGGLSCEGISLFEEESRPFEIPGKVTLARPVEIAPPRGAREAGH